MDKRYRLFVRDNEDDDIANELCFEFDTLQSLYMFVEKTEKYSSGSMFYEFYAI